jgi:thioredoxin-related protein
MKQLVIILVIGLLNFGHASAQDSTFNIYKPSENAVLALNKAIKQAKEEKKHVFVQIGGNWCVWCARFYKFTTADAQIDSLIKADYIVYHLNYSKENRNTQMLEKMGYPQRFGFPVFVILDENGERLNTQNSEYLEQGHSYNKTKVMEFLENWNVKALDPNQYKY